MPERAAAINRLADSVGLVALGLDGLKAEFTADKLENRKSRRWRTVLAALNVLLIFGLLIYARTNNQVINIVKDCTVDGGKCAERGARQQSGAIAQIVCVLDSQNRGLVRALDPTAVLPPKLEVCKDVPATLVTTTTTPRSSSGTTAPRRRNTKPRSVSTTTPRTSEPSTTPTTRPPTTTTKPCGIIQQTVDCK